MTFVDTGFLLALVQPADALHSRATAWAQKAARPLLVTEYVFWETINGLSKRPDRSKGVVLAEYVLKSSDCIFVRASSELLDAGLQLHASRPDKEWSLTDCISFHVMRERKITRALAHDIHFEQAGFEALLRADPI
jgi:predicted nucleic acid-binding protein